jgi:parallel beta-helix repeat protein
MLLTLSLAAVAAFGPVNHVPPPRGAVILTQYADIRHEVDSHSPDTTFYLRAGLYRTQSVQPKNGDTFLGAHGAILDGAKLLTHFSQTGRDYIADNQPIDPNTIVNGQCQKGYPRCDHPQDLYFDGRPLRAVAKRADVATGKWYYDYGQNAVYFADNPKGHAVELGYRPFAFGGNAKNVTVQNLVIENYASADQRGAINDSGGGTGWTVANNEVRWNHGYGLVDGTNNRVTGNNIHHNGEMGLGGGGGTTGALVDKNEIAFNAWNGTDCTWECGGAKWGDVSNLTVSNNYVHDNQGDGLWTDVGCTAITYEGNRIENNFYAGISHEISGAAVIKDNTFKGNGKNAFDWGWNGQIQIQNSSGTKVYGNTLVLDADKGGNGIMIIQQDRGSNHMPHDNAVHDNDVTMAGGPGAVAGWFADYKVKSFGKNNVFASNHYHVRPHGAAKQVWAPNGWKTFAAWQATGQDAHSTVDTNVSN